MGVAQLTYSMATSSSERRSRRAWRQPRNEPGSPSVTLDTPTTLTTVAPVTDTSSPDQSKLEETSSNNISLPTRVERTFEDTLQTTEDPPPARSLIEVDGSIMEGGGQILRNSITLSCLVGRPVCVTKIRGGRSKPGLRPQHLAGLHLIGQLCGGKMTGDGVNSTKVGFWPSSVRSGSYSADTQTAGSTTLLLQVALPCLLFAPPTSSSSLTLRGGTNADMAPPIDYITRVFQPTVEKFGITFDCELNKRGFYPRGGGEVIVRPHPLINITPATITERGQVVSVSIHSFVAGAVPEKAGQQMAQAARQQIVRQLSDVSINVTVVSETTKTAFGNGSGIIVVAETTTGCVLGGSANGTREEPPYKTGRAAADQVLKAVKEGACVDEHMQDQLILFMALANGRSTILTGPLSLHTKTAIHISHTFTSAVFNIRKLDGGAHLIECDGIGLKNPFS